ncbi:MAG TPA: hypothetical protein VK171_16335 [Fimbriimonas sp.]|nr:hypothetical protein [Fimbriimonas sp.]
MERTDLMDTSIEMHKVRLRLLREKGPQWRIYKALQLTQELNNFVAQAKKQLDYDAAK